VFQFHNCAHLFADTSLNFP